MSKVLAVAWRDFKYTALTKTFILAAVLFPVLMAGAMFAAQFFMNTAPPPLRGTLVIADSTSLVEPMARLELDPKHLKEVDQWINEEADPASGGAIGQETAKLREFPGMKRPRRGFGPTATPHVRLDIRSQNDLSDDAINRLKEQVRSGEVVAAAVIRPNLLDPIPGRDHFDLYITPGTIPDHSDLLAKAIGRAVVRARTQDAGTDLARAQALVHQPHALTRRIRPDGQETGEFPIIMRLIPMGFMMLLWISTFTSANYLLTSTIEEKSNKVMEVLLSAVSPMQLMAGKILGQGLVGMVMLVMYAGVAVAALVLLSMADLIPPITLFYLAVYFFMAYFMIASIMAGVGSAVSDLREAQALVTPATLILIVPLILWLPISQNPNGLLATITSFIPPMTPFAMILRVTGSEPVPTWQIIATIIYGYAMTVAMVGMCAKIFRVGVLMYGKPPTPWELLKWVRYS